MLCKTRVSEVNGGHGSTVRWKNTEADASTRKKKNIYFFNWQRVTHTHRSTQTYLIKVSAVQRPLILLHQPCSTWFDRRCSLRRKTTQQRSCHADGVGAGLELHGHGYDDGHKGRPEGTRLRNMLSKHENTASRAQTRSLQVYTGPQNYKTKAG